MFKYWAWVWEQREYIANHPYEFNEMIPQEVAATSLIGIIAIIFIIIGRKDDGRNAYGRASFAKSGFQISRMGFNYHYGLVFGKKGMEHICLSKPLSVLLLAPPGTGKTTGIVIPSVLNADHSLVIHDPKGEIYDITNKAKSKHSEVLLFDPTIGECAKYNPLCNDVLPKDKDEILNYIRNISKILIRTKSDTANTFFYEEAQNAFTFFACWLIWKEEETSFSKVRKKMLSHHEVTKTIHNMCPELSVNNLENEHTDTEDNDDNSEEENDWDAINNQSTPEYLIELGRGVLLNAGNDKQWAGIESTLRQSLDVFESQKVSEATNYGCDFTAKSLRKNSQTVYLRVKDIDKERLAPLMSIVFTSLSTGLLSELPEGDDHMVTFILDEFVRLGKMNSIVDMPAIGRGYNFNAMFIAQDYGQIIDLYGRDKLSAIESNTAYKIVLTQNNAETAKKVSEQIGNTTRKRYSESESSNTKDINNKGRSRSYSYESTPLMSAQDIMNMEIGEGIILAQNNFKHPIKIKLPYYFSTRKFKRMLDD